MPNPYKTVRFKSRDGLTITGDLYLADRPKAFALLCHRSHFNRGEYRASAQKLRTLGVSCLAIDQRSGMNVLGVTNETSTLAKRNGLPTGYLDARQDIEAAVAYAFKKSGRPILLVGSSYSASLALLIGKDNPKVGAVVAFSPGEYLKGVSVADELRGFAKPVWVTSSRQETGDVARLMAAVAARCKTQFKPKVKGAHGARVLWESTDGNAQYWKSLTTFLSNKVV